MHRVEDDHLVVLADESLGKMPPDETSTARYENTHQDGRIGLGGKSRRVACAGYPAGLPGGIAGSTPILEGFDP